MPVFNAFINCFYICLIDAGILIETQCIVNFNVNVFECDIIFKGIYALYFERWEIKNIDFRIFCLTL